LPFFIEFLQVSGRFAPWVESCPLLLSSPNAPMIYEYAVLITSLPYEILTIA
jgi:hypothetical protein